MIADGVMSIFHSTYPGGSTGGGGGEIGGGDGLDKKLAM